MNCKVEDLLRAAKEVLQDCPDLLQYGDLFTEDHIDNSVVMATKLSLFTGYSFEKLINFFNPNLKNNRDLNTYRVCSMLARDMKSELSKEEIDWIYDVTKRNLSFYDKIKDYDSNVSCKTHTFLIFDLFLIEDIITSKNDIIDLIKLRGLLCSETFHEYKNLLIEHCGITWGYHLAYIGDSIPKSSLYNLFLFSAYFSDKDIEEFRRAVVFDLLMEKYGKEVSNQRASDIFYGRK
jgi:hypothetical protein